MRATGIVRRLDDLGRIAIPREFRRTMRVKEGDPLELYVDDRGFYFKKCYADSTDIKRNLSEVSEYVRLFNDEAAIKECEKLLSSIKKVVDSIDKKR